MPEPSGGASDDECPSPEEADPGSLRRRVLRISLALAPFVLWIPYVFKTGDPHPRMLGAVVCGSYTLVAFLGLRKLDLVYFPLAALLTGLSFWLGGMPGVMLGLFGAVIGIGGMSWGVATLLLSLVNC